MDSCPFYWRDQASRDGPGSPPNRTGGGRVFPVDHDERQRQTDRLRNVRRNVDRGHPLAVQAPTMKRQEACDRRRAI
jgi:hypothetical protein